MNYSRIGDHKIISEQEENMCLLIDEIRVFPQGDGPDVQLRVFGDEFYCRYENMDGYTVVYDPDREKYCYAVLVEGSFSSSGTAIAKPVPPGIRRHLQEDKNIRNSKFYMRYSIMRPQPSPPPGVMGTLGRNNGLLYGRQLSKGSVLGLTILIDFQDIKAEIPAEQVEALLNSDNYKAHGNYCSVKEYYRMMSNGKLEYTNRVVGPITLSRKRNYYINSKLMREALNIVYNESGINFEEFDSRGEGIIDAINFLYAGPTVYEDWLWPHNHFIDLTFGGMKTDLYTIQSLGRRPVDLKIGTLCHETGHLLCRFPDLYDYGTRDGDSDPSAGMGYYCLMSSGNHLNQGRTPSPINSYLRDLAGWTEQEITLNNSDEYEVRHDNYSAVYRYETDRANEYFLIENRSRIGLNAFCPSEGIAVYHCDTLGSNEWSDGTADRHYQCALIQADGRTDLENNRNNGDDKDLFSKVSGLALSHSTAPSSKAWGGVESGLNLFDISKPGKTMRFKTGAPEIMIPVVTVEDSPGILIPDDDPAGLNRTLKIQKPGKIKSIEISVDINHTYIGDLEVSIKPPSGSAVSLHKHEGGRKDDLKKTYSSQTNADLAALAGKSIEGDWILSVKDTVARDTGRLNSWKIKVEYDLKKHIVREEAVPKVVIPDVNLDGITSAISVKKKGVAKDIKVDVEIDHTYIGDLQIALTAPTGQKVTLFQFGEGKNKVNLKKVFDSKSIPALESLAKSGPQMQGKWKLHVVDNAAADEGTLGKWSIELTH
jgi:M6 family metalloprotease-like protein